MGLRESKSVPTESQDEVCPLHAVARKGRYDDACRLLSLGTEAIDSQDAMGRSPLFWATEYRQERLVELLLAHGADPAARDKEGNLCLHWAASVGAAPITRMLLEAGSDPNAPNDQGDAPLHVAAREKRYECLVLLLAHGANACLKNKAGQTPPQCTRPGSPSWSALQAFSALPLSQGERVLSRDISRGFEQVPIPCLNGVDDEPCPADFLYVTQNILAGSVAVPAAARGSSQHCSCPGACFLASCPCVLRSRCPPYTMDGRLTQGTSTNSSAEMATISECHALCSCARSCPNRVVQRGTRVQLQLFRTPAKGWGVRTVQDVPCGAFLCQYFGELLSSTELGRRQADAYCFATGTMAGQECYLDGRFYGNVGRFLNHSCQPNLVAVPVAVGREVPGIAFFSTRPVRAGEELGFDYGDGFWAGRGAAGPCLCDAPACRYRAGDLAAGDLAVPAPAPAGPRGFALKSRRPLTRARRPRGPAACTRPARQ